MLNYMNRTDTRHRGAFDSNLTSSDTKTYRVTQYYKLVKKIPFYTDGHFQCLSLG